MDVLQHVEGVPQQRSTDLQLGRAVGQLTGKGLTLVRDGRQSLADLGRRDLAGGGQVEQVLLLGVKPSQSRLPLRGQQQRRASFLGQGGRHERPHPLDQVLGESDRGVVPQHRSLDVFDRLVARGALAALTADAEEVQVLAAVADRSLHDQP